MYIKCESNIVKGGRHCTFRGEIRDCPGLIEMGVQESSEERDELSQKCK